jgi:hypothetical protein
MLKKTIFMLLIFRSVVAMGQMNFQDSSVQVISYWDLGERYEYAVTYQKLQYSGVDTTLNETMTYDVDVSVIDSTANSYTVRWFYKNFKSDSKNPIIQKLTAISENIPVDIKLNEVGMIQSVMNWEAVRDYIAASIDSLRSGLPQIPEIDKMFQRLQAIYSNQASIETAAIQDAWQFHSFYGGKYNLNETTTGQLKTANLYYPDNPFDTEFSVTLEELDQSGNQYVIRSVREVNPEQLAESTYRYIKDMYKDLNKEVPQRELFKELKYTEETVSQIHNTGWVLESILWKEVVSDGTTNMEIRKILMK